MLHLTRNLNRASTRLRQGPTERTGHPVDRKAGKLSGGQQAQLALTLALGRRPRLLVLDEPMASLDPLARHDFMATVMAAIADDGVSVVLSCHVLAELERVADYFVILSRGGVQVAGEVDDLLACHVLTRPDAEADRYAEGIDIVHALHSKAQTQFLFRTNGSVNAYPPSWNARPITLEELAHGISARSRAASLPGPSRGKLCRTDGGGTVSAFAAPTRHWRSAPNRPWSRGGKWAG